jgi:uncharacterized YceG family protein
VTAPGGGRHPESGGLFGPGYGAPRYEPARYDPPSWGGDLDAGRFRTADRPAPGYRQASGLIDRYADATGPMVEPDWWSYGSSDDPDYPVRARHGRDDEPGQGSWDSRLPGDDSGAQRHPSAPIPPLPTGAWDRLRSRQPHDGDDDATVAQPLLPSAPLDGGAHGDQASGRMSGPAPDDDATDAHPLASSAWEDETGGLDVIGAHVEEEPPRRSRRARREGRAAAATHRSGTGGPVVDANAGPDALVHDEAFGEDIPVKPYDARAARRRRRRRPLAILLAILVLAGVVGGIVVGGQQLLTMIDPSSRDFTGEGTTAVEIRVRNGDTLSDIARTLVDAGVIASIAPFVDAAEANADAMGIQPGVYSVRLEMSGQAALDRLLDPEARLLSRVTVPEGLTVQRTLAKLAEATGRPIEEFQAAADPAALGVPAYANGQLEGYLYPATYDVDPGDMPADILRRMVQEFNEVAGQLQLEQRAAAAGRTPAEVVTVASMVQAETRLEEERPDVAQVIYNRLDQGIALGIDATLAFGLDKNGNELTGTDLRTDGPYNTRTRPGLPPTPISSPGEASLEAALAPSSGDLLYYVLESAEGRHFFTNDYAEFQAARQRCAEAGLGCGG